MTAAFLEVTAIVELAWTAIWEDMEQGASRPTPPVPDSLPRLPKTIDFTVGLPAFPACRAMPMRGAGRCVRRRYASVHVEAWQDNRSRLFAQATGHFLMPQDG